MVYYACSNWHEVKAVWDTIFLTAHLVLDCHLGIIAHSFEAMSKSDLKLVFEGDDESVPYRILNFADLEDEFPDLDFACLSTADIMHLAYTHCDDWTEDEFDSGMPGGCYGVFKFYSKNPTKLKSLLRAGLRPLCESLS